MVEKASDTVQKARNFLARDGPGAFDQPDLKSPYNTLRTTKKLFHSGLYRCFEYRFVVTNVPFFLGIFSSPFFGGFAENGHI